MNEKLTIIGPTMFSTCQEEFSKHKMWLHFQSTFLSYSVNSFSRNKLRTSFLSLKISRKLFQNFSYDFSCSLTQFPILTIFGLEDISKIFLS